MIDDKGRAILLCGQCEDPVYFDTDAEGRAHKCGCTTDDDLEQPDGYTIAKKNDLLSMEEVL